MLVNNFFLQVPSIITLNTTKFQKSQTLEIVNIVIVLEEYT